MKSAWLFAGLSSVALATGAVAQEMDFAKVEILTEKLGPNVYMLTGSSGLDPSHEDAAGGRMLAELRGRSGGPTAVAFAPDGTTLATGSGDGAVKLWAVRPK